MAKDEAQDGAAKRPDVDDVTASTPAPAEVALGGFQAEANTPQISYSERPAGRETLSAIADSSASPRDPLTTKHYGDRISNAPGAMSPRQARALDDRPEITVRESAAGRATQAAIDLELGGEGPEIEVREAGGTTGASETLAARSGAPASEARPTRQGQRHDFSGLSVESVHTFHLRAPLDAFPDRQARRALLEQRLLKYLPVPSVHGVTRIELSGGDAQGTCVVRVWCIAG